MIFLIALLSYSSLKFKDKMQRRLNFDECLGVFCFGESTIQSRYYVVGTRSLLNVRSESIMNSKAVFELVHSIPHINVH